MSKEDRLDRDLKQLQKFGGKQKEDQPQEEPSTPIRPGEKGWCYRARVPVPMGKDYVHRPKWSLDGEINMGKQKKTKTKIEKHMIKMQKNKHANKMKCAVNLSIEGRNMAL